MSNFKTPGVYVQEVSTLPPSVAPVATAVPAFIGYTETALDNDGTTSLTNVPTRINSLVEYQTHFGGAFNQTGIAVSMNVATGIATATVATPSNFVMYYQMQLYFANGGGPCYIVSVGNYSSSISLGTTTTGLRGGLEATAREDEPTLLVFPDAAAGLSHNDLYSLYTSALAQCHTLQDRFTIMDVHDHTNLSTSVSDFRSGVVSSYLNYGAAYYPYLQTSLSYAYIESAVDVTYNNYYRHTSGALQITYTGTNGGSNPTVAITLSDVATISFTITHSAAPYTMVITVPDGANPSDTHTTAIPTEAEVVAAWTAWKSANNPRNFDIVLTGAGTTAVASLSATPLTPPASVTLNTLETSDNTAYHAAVSAIDTLKLSLSPSAAMAGVYARTDRDRGVWKAPANTPLANVLAPAVKITDATQGDLNVDANTGKSINAIRAFYGKGTLVWGARTLAGNDNEWRYVSTRRLFITVEESVRKSTAWTVFEPNTANTWIKVKAQIENYLNGLWRDGALAGATPDEAYFVHVGLGVTMNPQDILNGSMNIEIGMAAVRPAEFIILKFSHKLQRS
ncbi:MAG: phage tail sheath C-terminal domain-containing protein [Bacteroidota bacterium]